MTAPAFMRLSRNMSAMEKYKPVLQHGHNRQGRDLVVSDIHGCYDSLMRVLDQAKFDPACGDRLFSVGDLIDRGPRSWDTLKLLNEPWMHLVRGNHEDMLLSALDCFDSILHSSVDIYPNGGKWLIDLSDEQIHELQTLIAPKLQASPHVRSVLNEQGDTVLFHIAHAELLRPGRNRYFDPTQDSDTEAVFYDDAELALLAAGQEPADWDEDKFVATSTWGRRAVRAVMSDSLSDRPVTWFNDFPMAQGATRLAVSPTPYSVGLSPVFVGHTILDRAAMHASHIFTDLGCVGTYRSTREDNGMLCLIDAQKTLAWLKERLPRPEDEQADPLTPMARGKMPLP